MANENWLLGSHDNNQYIIVIPEQWTIGMMSINETRPFSLDSKNSQSGQLSAAIQKQRWNSFAGS